MSPGGGLGDDRKRTGLPGRFRGLGLISYYDKTNGDLKVAHCSNAACTEATTATLDSEGDVGTYTSVTTGADGLGLISYFDFTNHDLKVAHCSNAACTEATTSTLDSDGVQGRSTSVTIGSDGLGLISYYDDTKGDLKVAHCLNVACTYATRGTVERAGDVGRYPSVTIGADGLALITYSDETNKDLKVAHCWNAACWDDLESPSVQLEFGLLPPSVILDDNVEPIDESAYAHRDGWVSEATVTKFFIATETGSYDIGYSLEGGAPGADLDIVVTRHVPVVPLPGAGDTNGDNNVDVLDLVTVATNLGNYYGP